MIFTPIFGDEDEADEIKDDLRNSFENLKKFYENGSTRERRFSVNLLTV